MHGLNVVKRTLFPDAYNDGDVHVPLIDMQDDGTFKQSGGKEDGLKSDAPSGDTGKTSSEVESRGTTTKDKVWLAMTVILLVATVALPIYGYWQGRRNQARVETLNLVTQFTSGLECGKYNANTGVYSLTRGGLYFERPAHDDVQFLTGFDSACTSCPAVPSATYGLVTPGDCSNINDGLGNAGIANRRSKNIACSASATFTSGVHVGAAVANRFTTTARSIMGRTNAGSSELARCDSSDFLAAAGSDALHTTSLRDELTRTRNAYFVNTGDRVGMCFCQPCGLSATTSINAAGGASNCDAYSAYAGQTTEVCVYSPVASWGGDFLV